MLATLTLGQPAPGAPPARSLTGETQGDPPSTEKTVILVEGQITNVIGAGETGATVTVRWKTEDGKQGKLIATTTTNELGDFVITVAEPIRGDIVVTVSKDPFASIVREYPIGEEDSPPYLAASFRGNVVVTGCVTDALTKKPVAGASVNLKAFYQDWYARTDDKGLFTIDGLFPGPAVLVVEAEGYGRERLTVRVGAETKGAENHLDGKPIDAADYLVEIKPERIIHLNTVDEQGKPITGTTIECYDEPRDDFRTIVTDPAGLATLRGIHFDASSLSLRLTHDDYVSSEGFDHRIKTPADRTESTHKLVLLGAGRITGTVTAAQTGRPLSGARVMTGTYESDESPRDWADYEGKYTIRGVKPGSTAVTVHLSGRAPEFKSVEVKVGETAVVDIQLGPPAVLRGTVKNTKGDPVADAYIYATKWRGFGTLGLRALTGLDGRFVMENAPADEFDIAVFASGAGHVNQTVQAGIDRHIEITVTADPESARPGGASGLKVGDTAPLLALTALGGESIKMVDLKGKTILLDFWATWCPPCLADMSHLAEAHDKFGTRDDFAMIGISLDSDKKMLTDFVKGRKLTWPQVFGETAREAAGRYGVSGIPVLFLIGPDGTIAAIHLRGSAIVKRLERILQPGNRT